MTVYQGIVSAKDLRIALVCGRFNSMIVDQLHAGAIDAVVRSGGDKKNVDTFYCPGAFEIPQVATQIAQRGNQQTGGYSAIVCLGAIIRGATPHFDYVAGVAANGVSQAAQSSGVPITFGVLTTDTIEQAIERAGTKAGNKGFDATVAAIEMARLYEAVSSVSPRASR